MSRISKLLIAITVGSVFLSGPSWAEPKEHEHGKEDSAKPTMGMMGSGGQGGMMGGHKAGMMGGKHKKGGPMMFTMPWMKTLTDEQKLEIDKMHLEVAIVEKPLRAQMKAAKMELNVLAVQDKPDMRAIKQAIQKITNLKAKIMQNRYEHIVEMRASLTPQQQISYDMGVLSSGMKKKGKH